MLNHDLNLSSRTSKKLGVTLNIIRVTPEEIIPEFEQYYESAKIYFRLCNK